jgi:hypothetical protein
MMDAVMAGEPLDADAMEKKLGEIDVLHQEWMEIVARAAQDDAGSAKPARRRATK